MNKITFIYFYILCALTINTTHASMIHLYSQPDVTAPLLIEIDSERSPLKHILFYEAIDGVSWYSAEWVQENMLQMTEGYVPLSAMNKQGELLPGTQLYSEPVHTAPILTLVHPGNQFHIKSVNQWLHITLEQYPIVYFYEIEDFSAESLAVESIPTDPIQLALLKNTLDSEIQAPITEPSPADNSCIDFSAKDTFLENHTSPAQVAPISINIPKDTHSVPPTNSVSYSTENHATYVPNNLPENAALISNNQNSISTEVVPSKIGTHKVDQPIKSAQQGYASNPVRYLEGTLKFTRSALRLSNGYKIHYSLVNQNGAVMAYLKPDNKLIESAFATAKNQHVMLEGVYEAINARDPIILHTTHITQNSL